MNRYCLALDLVNDAGLIEEYEAYHKNIWPEIRQSIFDSGIIAMSIYRAGNRLFMIMETGDNFSFDRKAAMDESNQRVQEWENLMWKYQQAIPVAKPGQKWVLMEKIFEIAAEE
jgi:L-rhamnose mutarotase